MDADSQKMTVKEFILSAFIFTKNKYKINWGDYTAEIKIGNKWFHVGSDNLVVFKRDDIITGVI